MKTGIISNEKYNPARIERIRNLLEAAAEKGRPRYFEIFVDELKVVEKTDDLECFDEYKIYMDEHTRVLKIQIYTSTENSPRNDKFIFALPDPLKDNKTQELSGLEVESKISNAIEKERTRNETIMLQREVELLKQRLADADDQIDTLQEQLDKTEKDFEVLRNKKVSLSEMNSGRLLGFATDFFVKNYPGISSKLPIISTLSGFLTDGDTAQPQQDNAAQPPAEGCATFTPKKQTPQTPPTDSETLAKLSFFSDMEAAFDDVGLKKVLEIVRALIACPEGIEKIHRAFYGQTET